MTYLAQTLDYKLVSWSVAVADLLEKVLKLELKRSDLKPPELGLEK